MYQGTVTGYVFVKGEAHDDAFSDGETFSNDVTGGESVRVEISLPTIDTVSGTLGYFQRKSHAENNGSAHSTTDRFTDTRRFSLTASEFENKDASADQSSFTRTATRFTESSREGSAHMNMGMSGNSRQHADAQQGRDSAAHSDSKAHSRMASESQSHAQSEGTENRDKQGQSMSRKWGQIGASLAAFLDNVQGQIDALLHRKSINQSSAWRKMPTGTIQPHPCNPQWGHGLYILPACGPVGVPMQGQPVPATAPTGLPRRLNGL